MVDINVCRLFIYTQWESRERHPRDGKIVPVTGAGHLREY